MYGSAVRISPTLPQVENPISLTDAYQIGLGYSYKDFSGKFRFTDFDNPVANADLQEYTLNLLYEFSSYLKGGRISVDFSVLDYENNAKDATDLRSCLIFLRFFRDA